MENTYINYQVSSSNCSIFHRASHLCAQRLALLLQGTSLIYLEMLIALGLANRKSGGEKLLMEEIRLTSWYGVYMYVCIYIYHISHYLLFMTPVDFGSLSHYLHGFIHPSWLALGFLPSTGTLDLPANYPRMLINLKLLHVILVVTSQHPGWGEVDPTYTEWKTRFYWRFVVYSFGSKIKVRKINGWISCRFCRCLDWY